MDQTISFRAYLSRGLFIGLIMSTFIAAIACEWTIGLFCFASLYGGNLIAAWVKDSRMVKAIAENINQPADEKASATRVFIK